MARAALQPPCGLANRAACVPSLTSATCAQSYGHTRYTSVIPLLPSLSELPSEASFSLSPSNTI